MKRPKTRRAYIEAQLDQALAKIEHLEGELAVARRLQQAAEAELRAERRRQHAAAMRRSWGSQFANGRVQ